MSIKKTTLQHRKLVVKAGMTAEDVKNSKDATALQKKYANVFDSDGQKGFSQREADVFNATIISDHGKQGVSLWTRYQDGSKKETKYVGDVDSFKFTPKGDVKPYVVKKGSKQQPTRPQQLTRPLPPLTEVVYGDTLTYYSKQDSIEFHKKDNAGWAKYKNADNAGWTKYKNADNAGWAKYKNAKTDKERSKAGEEWYAMRAKAAEEYEAMRAKAGEEWYAMMDSAKRQHCSQVREGK